MAIKLLNFEAALKLSTEKKHLLLGNGFSIALKPDIFSYESLYKSADFKKIPYAEALFDALETRDFEAVIRLLVGAAKLLKAYNAPQELIDQIVSDSSEIKNILVAAIASKHPDRPYEITPEQYANCRVFLAHFSHIYTLNYDVLLYWALMQDEVDEIKIDADDGFRHPEDDYDAPYVAWQEAHSPTIHYLHGALHLFDAGFEIIKYTWSKTDIPIVDQIRDALDNERYPLFVSEGTTQSKFEKILHNAYLHKAYRSFKSICDQTNASIFVYGHSLADNDRHIFKRISRGRVRKLFVSIFGDPNSAANVRIITKAQALVEERKNRNPKYPLEVHFFDASSAKIWG